MDKICGAVAKGIVKDSAVDLKRRRTEHKDTISLLNCFIYHLEYEISEPNNTFTNSISTDV